MITLKESILSKTKDKIQQTKSDISRNQYFGGVFQFIPSRGLFRHGDMSIISIKALDKLTKGMEFKNPDTKKIMDDGFIYHSDKVEKFVMWLENIDLYKMGVNDIDVNSNVSLGKLCSAIKKKMYDDGIFNKPQIIDVNFFRGSNEGDGCFYISIKKKSEYSRLAFHFDKID
jgi:hypothetical protein